MNTPSPERVVLDNAELTSNAPDVPQLKWGWVSARPSEFLIAYRGGKLRPSLCGQGGRFFKWPSDAYVLVPTTLKEVVFVANQVTSDFVDVKVRGMIVYRIADPHRAHTLISFSDRPRAEAKLAQMISDLSRSTVKSLVANLKLDECLRRRKEEIVAALAREVAAEAVARWGVEIAAIDVQDVFVQDEALFQSMQASFKAERGREATMTQLAVERTLSETRLTNERQLEKERQELALENARREADLELAKLALQRRCDEEKFALERARAEAARERALMELDAQRLLHDEELRVTRERIAVESGAGRASLERLFIREALPQVADAVARSMSNAQLNVYQTGADGAGLLPMALRQIFDMVNPRKE